MIDLGFLGQAEEPQSDEPPPQKPHVARFAFWAAFAASGGYIGWKLDGAPGLAMGAAGGAVVGVVALKMFERKVEEDVSKMFDSMEAKS